MVLNRDAFYDRTTDYELFLLGLATATWAEIVTHFIAALFLLLFELKSWSFFSKHHYCCFLPQHDFKP